MWLYDKTTQRIIRRPTKKICCEEGFTTFSTNEVPPGVNHKFVETELSKWERKQSFVITKLLEARTIEVISPIEFGELIRFTVWLYFCNPAHRAILRQGRSELQLLNIKFMGASDLDKLYMKFFGLMLPHTFLRKQLEMAAANDDLLQSEFLGLVLECAELTFEFVLKEYAWHLADYKSLGAALCTSDRPVLIGGMTLPGPVGFGTPGCTLFFPLSPDLCLVGKNVGENKRFIACRRDVTDPEFLRIPNLLAWGKSHRYIIAAEKEYLPTPGMELPSYLPTSSRKGNTIKFSHR